MWGTMSWDVRDAIVLIDQLLENFGPVSSKADEVVGQAKILATRATERSFGAPS